VIDIMTTETKDRELMDMLAVEIVEQPPTLEEMVEQQPPEDGGGDPAKAPWYKNLRTYAGALLFASVLGVSYAGYWEYIDSKYEALEQKYGIEYLYLNDDENTMFFCKERECKLMIGSNDYSRPHYLYTLDHNAKVTNIFVQGTGGQVREWSDQSTLAKHQPSIDYYLGLVESYVSKRESRKAQKSAERKAREQAKRNIPFPEAHDILTRKRE